MSVMNKEEFTKHLSTLSVDDKEELTPYEIHFIGGVTFECKIEEYQKVFEYSFPTRDYNEYGVQDRTKLCSFQDIDTMLLWLYDHGFLPDYNKDEN